MTTPSRDLAQQSLNAVGPKFSLRSRVLVEAKRDPGLRKARACMVGPEVKGRVAHVFNEFDFVWIQLERVSVVPSCDSVGQGFVMAHLKKSLDQLVCVKQSGSTW